MLESCSKNQQIWKEIGVKNSKKVQITASKGYTVNVGLSALQSAGIHENLQKFIVKLSLFKYLIRMYYYSICLLNTSDF